MSEKKKRDEEKTEKEKLDSEPSKIQIDRNRVSITPPSEEEEDIVADPEGARRHGQTPAA